jgi:hypothetical protein
MHFLPVLDVIMIGVLATALLDGWVAILNRMGVATLPMGLIGRWVGHMGRGRIAHAAIRQAASVRYETTLGWIVHYATGVAFAAVLGAVVGPGWLDAPTPGPALLMGALSVGMPLFIMQPAMGAGFASSRTPTPAKNVVRSVANHLVLGLGFYLAAVVIRAIGL